MLRKLVPLFVGLALLIFACGDDVSSVIPKTHSAYEFYQVAKSLPTRSDVCESHGGKVIDPNDYDVLENPAKGVSVIQQKSTRDLFLGVSFGETASGIVTEKMCCWPK